MKTMKTFLSILVISISAFLFTPHEASASRSTNVYNDSGSAAYLVQTTNIARTYYIQKQGAYVWNQQNNVYVQAANGVIYQFNYVTDSININGAKPTSLGACLAQLNQLLRPGYKTYELHKVGTATTYRVIKSGRGNIGGFQIDSIGTGTGGSLATVSIWDGTDSTGTLIGTYTTASTGTINFPPGGINFSKGLVMKPRGTTVGRFTVSYYYCDPKLYDGDLYPEDDIVQ